MADKNLNKINDNETVSLNIWRAHDHVWPKIDCCENRPSKVPAFGNEVILDKPHQHGKNRQ